MFTVNNAEMRLLLGGGGYSDFETVHLSHDIRVPKKLLRHWKRKHDRINTVLARMQFSLRNNVLQ